MTDEHAMKVAKVIAKAMGDNFSDAFKNKQRWTAKRGMSGGRFRDVNEPFQDDYIAAAQAAIAALDAARGDQVARVVEWLRNGGGTDISQLNGSMQMLFLKGMNRYADAIERGEPFRD